MHGRLVLVLALLALAGCPKSADPAPPKDAPKDAPQNAPASGPIAADVLRAVCKKEPCGGDRPVVRVYRDDKGAVKKLFRIYGACSHSPGIYFDPDGTQTEIIPEKPIVPGSPEAEELKKKHDKQIGGLVHESSVRCSDGMWLPP